MGAVFPDLPSVGNHYRAIINSLSEGRNIRQDGDLAMYEAKRSGNNQYRFGTESVVRAYSQ